MWVGFPVIEYEGRQWAVVTITWSCTARQYDLRLRSGWEDKFITIASGDYDALFDPDINPQQTFDLREDGNGN